jgi:hypothetical protein
MTLYVEDLILALYSVKIPVLWDSTVIDSFCLQILKQEGFTEKQSGLALKLLKKYVYLITPTFGNITPAIENPIYKYAFRKIPTNNRISICEHGNWQKAIKLEFPFDQFYVDEIKKSKLSNVNALWNPEQKAWFFPLSEESIKFVSQLVSGKNFEKDEEFKIYETQIEQIIENIDSYVPMIVLENNIPKYRNISQFLPELTNTDVISALFEARDHGVSVWNDDVSEYIKSNNADQFVLDFLNHNSKQHFYVNSKNHRFEELKSLLSYLTPTVVLVPAGEEYNKLTSIYDSLKTMGYDDSEMSVLFRLSSDSGSKFNDFVKNHHLNDPISDRTKFVFICTKVPKTILKSNVQFKSLINLGYVNVHYTIKEYMKNCQNVVYYSDKNPTKETNFANLLFNYP